MENESNVCNTQPSTPEPKSLKTSKQCKSQEERSHGKFCSTFFSLPIIAYCSVYLFVISAFTHFGKLISSVVVFSASLQTHSYSGFRSGRVLGGTRTRTRTR